MDEKVETVEGDKGHRPDALPGAGFVLAALAATASLVCLAMVLYFGGTYLEVALYVTGLAAAAGIGSGVVSLLRGHSVRHGGVLGSLVLGGLALGLTIWAHRVVRERMDLQRRVAALGKILEAAERFAADGDGRLPARVDELAERAPAADVLAQPPAGLRPDDYVITQDARLTLVQLELHRGDREVILLHDGGAAGREPAVVGLLGGQVRTVPWQQLTEQLEQQRLWLRRLERSLTPPATEPSTAPATEPATRPTSDAATQPRRGPEPSGPPSGRAATTRISTTVPADDGDT